MKSLIFLLCLQLGLLILWSNEVSTGQLCGTVGTFCDDRPCCKYNGNYKCMRKLGNSYPRCVLLEFAESATKCKGAFEQCNVFGRDENKCCKEEGVCVPNGSNQMEGVCVPYPDLEEVEPTTTTTTTTERPASDYCGFCNFFRSWSDSSRSSEPSVWQAVWGNNRNRQNGYSYWFFG